MSPLDYPPSEDIYYWNNLLFTICLGSIFCTFLLMNILPTQMEILHSEWHLYHTGSVTVLLSVFVRLN